MRGSNYKTLRGINIHELYLQTYMLNVDVESTVPLCGAGLCPLNVAVESTVES